MGIVKKGVKNVKINGPHHTNFNPYKNQLKAQENIKKETTSKDQLEISKQAKQLQETEKPDPKRATYVQEIKKAYESGEYQVDLKQTVQKMINFWSK